MSKLTKRQLSAKKKKAALSILKKLRRAGFEAYFAGGCVRDQLLKKIPEDYDVATDAVPEVVIKLFKKTVPVGVQFGVVLVVQNGISVEVATFRKDFKYVDGRHPTKVKFSTVQEDVKRRDFTINGLMYDPIKRKVIDLVGGKSDLKRGVIRAIGDPKKRFNEDKLRMIRAIRFSARFGYKIEKKTWDALKNKSSSITQVSFERIRDEMTKILTGKNVDKALELLLDSGILKKILPEVLNLVGVDQPPAFHPEGDVFEHTKLLFKFIDKPSVVLAYSALLHDIGKPKTFRIAERIRFDGHVELGAKMSDVVLKRFKCSNDLIKKVHICILNHLRFMHVRQMREAKLKKFLISDTFSDELELHRADCLASHGDLSNYRFCKRKLSFYKKKKIALKPKPLIDGYDLIKLGFTPGPIFSRIMNVVEDMQLSGLLKDKKSALDFIKKKY